MSKVRLGRTFALALCVLVSGAPEREGPPHVIAGEPAKQNAGFTTITTAQLVERLARKDFFFVNVHIPYEGEIEETDAFIPFDTISENLGKLPADRSAPIILYCRSGRMSETAAGDLAALGFTQVAHVAGGMVEWARGGHQILQK